MAAMPLSASLYGFSRTKMTPSSYSLRSSMAFSIPSIKTALGSSKSAIFQHGISLQPSSFPGVLQSRSFTVNARAATEKSIYDFTVKVIVLGKNPFFCPPFDSFVVSLSCKTVGYCSHFDSSVFIYFLSHEV